MNLDDAIWSPWGSRVAEQALNLGHEFGNCGAFRVELELDAVAFQREPNIAAATAQPAVQGSDQGRSESSCTDRDDENVVDIVHRPFADLRGRAAHPLPQRDDGWTS